MTNPLKHSLPDLFHSRLDRIIGRNANVVALVN